MLFGVLAAPGNAENGRGGGVAYSAVVAYGYEGWIGHWIIRIWDLFRISSFELRVCHFRSSGRPVCRGTRTIRSHSEHERSNLDLASGIASSRSSS
jgi:hypothetical protein